MFALRTLEFDRIVEVVVSLALTPLGAAELAALTPSPDCEEVAHLLEATTECTRYLESNPLFPLRASAGLGEALDALSVIGRPLEPLQLRVVAEFLESVDAACAGLRQAAGNFANLRQVAARGPSFKGEVAEVRQAIDASGEVLDAASPDLRSIRDRLRRERVRLRHTLEQFVRGRDTAKYLQEQVVTERNGRYVLLVRAEHRGNVPGIVHGSSASGASLFLEPASTVEVNNDIVELEGREREEIARILLALSDAFRARWAEVEVCMEVAAHLDVLQAKARFGSLVNGTAPVLAGDAGLELRDARHPLLIEAVVRRLSDDDGTHPPTPVPIDLVLAPPSRVLLMTGPNTGGKTVALKTAGLLALMAQAGLHVPARRAILPVFRSIYADIGDEQSISASLSTFSAHISNIVGMDRSMVLPSLVLLDEVGTGTDPNEGGALATAIVSHFKQRGATIIATTHYDALKTWGTGTPDVTLAAFAFDAASFAPTYRLVYGAPGRSLAIEMAQRLGLPLPVVAAARGALGEDQKRLAAHLERVDAQARALDSERSRLQREKRAHDDANRALTAREQQVADREERFNRRLNERLDERVRQARREIDEVIAQLKVRADRLVEDASRRVAAGISTGDAGTARAEARASLEQIVQRLRGRADGAAEGGATSSDGPGTVNTSDQDGRPGRGGRTDRSGMALGLEVGARVAVVGLGMEGTVVSVQGKQAELDVRGKRLRTPIAQLRVVAAAPGPGSPASAPVRVNVDLQPREGLLSEINIVGSTVDQGIDRVARFLDETLVTDLKEVRIVHGHGTGQLRRGVQQFLKTHPFVQKFYPAPENQGGGGATVVELKE